jgi:hypothetical protein
MTCIYQLQNQNVKTAPKTLSIEEASLAWPSLARLRELSRESNARLKALSPILPPALQQGLKAGPIEGTEWCILVANNAMAAKLRQLLPDMQARLRQLGWDVQSIRLKIQSR